MTTTTTSGDINGGSTTVHKSSRLTSKGLELSHELSQEVPRENDEDSDNFIFVEYLGQGHLHPQRVVSAKPKNVASLKVSCLSPNAVSYLKLISPHLNMLDLSGCGLLKIALDLISTLDHLQTLILDDNRLSDHSSFCKEFPHILGKSLREMSLVNNSLSTMPPKMEDFTKLLRLKVSKNSIPNLAGIEKLKRLRLLAAEENEISQLSPGFYSGKRLENVYLSWNKLSLVGGTGAMSFRTLVSLRELDLSHNSIRSVPGELFLLPKIEIIKLNHNKISRLPRFKTGPRLQSPISFVDLSWNLIARFPDCVMKVTTELDLSGNKIRIVPGSILKNVSFRSPQKVILVDNPLVDPPKEICEAGLHSMVQYFEETDATSVRYHGVKVFCLGDPGKDRVVNLVMDQEGEGGFQILDMVETSSRNLDPSSSSTKDQIPLFALKILNMSGDRNEFHILQLFLTNPALNLIFLDVDRWTDDRFRDSLECWLQNLLAKHNQVNFLLVGVTEDPKKINSNEIQLKGNKIQTQVRELFSEYKARLGEEIRQIERKEKITSAMSRSLKKLLLLNSFSSSSFSSSLISSSSSLDPNILLCVNHEDPRSMKKLSSEILRRVSDPRVFQTALSTVPSFWSDVQTYLEEESHKFPIMSFQDFENLLLLEFNLKPPVRKVARYLQEVGTILWSEGGQDEGGLDDHNESVPHWIVTSPSALVDCCRILFCQDLRTYLTDPNDPDKNRKRFKRSFNNSRLSFENVCDILMNDAILLPELGVILLENVIPDHCVSRMLFYLCECWNLGYIIQYPGYYEEDWSCIYSEAKGATSEMSRSTVPDNQENQTKSSDSRRPFTPKSVQVQKCAQMPPLFMVLLNTKKESSEDLLEKFGMEDNLRISIQYSFPMGYPKLIFEQATSRINDRKKFKTLPIDHWVDGLLAQIQDSPIFILLERFPHKKNVIKYSFMYEKPKEFYHENIGEDVKASEVWKSVHEILNNMDELLNSYQGLWFERWIQCPNCTQFSFPGTWHSYNDSDPGSTLECKTCLQRVSIYLLEPPKVIKNVSSEEIIKNIRKQFHRD